MNSFEDLEKGHKIICNGAKTELPQAGSGNGVRIIAIVTRVKEQQEVEPRRFNVETLTWPSVGVKPNTWKSWGFGVLRDSRMFKARQQGEKHLALGFSWCHWKGLET